MLLWSECYAARHQCWCGRETRYNGVIMSVMASQISGVPIFLLNGLFRHRPKVNTKALRHSPLWAECTSGRWIPLKRTSNDENVSNWWRYHARRVADMMSTMSMSVGLVLIRHTNLAIAMFFVACIDAKSTKMYCWPPAHLSLAVSGLVECIKVKSNFQHWQARCMQFFISSMNNGSGWAILQQKYVDTNIWHYIGYAY